MAIPVKLEVFEGPLDLLLHLIEKNKLDIYDIPIVEVTEQYLEYIRQMEKEDMNIMSEFLVMAATLIDMKCRMLLPREIDEEGEEIDPREELVQQLLEYKMYKYMSLELRDLQVDAGRNFFGSPQIPEEVRKYKEPVDCQALLSDLSLDRLQEIFHMIMKRQEDRVDPVRSTFGKIERDEIDMEAKTGYVMEYARNHARFSFQKLLEKQKSRMEIVVTFLIILEMMKMGQIAIEQQSICSDIMIISRMSVDG